MDRRLIAILFTAGLVSLAVIVVSLKAISDDNSSAAQSPVVRAPASAFQGALLPPGVRAPDFALRDQSGKQATMKEYRGRVVVVTFLYSHCKTECPVEAQQIKGALDDVGHDVPVLAVSVDPPGDTPKSVDRFNAEQGVTGRIRWVLGRESQLRRLWDGYHTTSQTPQAEHMARLVLVDKRGFQRIGYPASQVTPERLAHDLRLLEKE
jgi:protein SCO1/2